MAGKINIRVGNGRKIYFFGVIIVLGMDFSGELFLEFLVLPLCQILIHDQQKVCRDGTLLLEGYCIIGRWKELLNFSRP